MILSTSGGSFPFTLGRIENGYRVRPDLCAINCSSSPTSFLKQIFVDSLVQQQSSLDLVVKIMGEVSFCLQS
jgi:aminocarboxymuconate-semialdehyde decarboxylase